MGVKVGKVVGCLLCQSIGELDGFELFSVGIFVGVSAGNSAGLRFGLDVGSRV